MSELLRNNRTGPAARQKMVVMVADPQAARRRALVRGPSRHDLIEAASLSEIYPTAEETVPDVLALSADFLVEPELEGVIRLADLIGASVLLYVEEGTPPLRSPLLSRLRLVSLRRGARIDDLLASRAESPAALAPIEGEARLPDLVLIGASTGGIAAIETVLMAFPADCPPTVIVQHIRDGFVPGLVQRLNKWCRPRVVEAVQDMPLRRGTVCIASDATRHLTVSGQASPRCVLVDSPPCHGHRPAVDPLFESTLGWGDRVAAALLTGMGSDGALGLAALRRGGAHTIAQDRSTSIVWGMPGAAVAAGAADAVLPIDRIGPALLSGRARTRVTPARGPAG
ncbi:MAG: CheB methylesterase domain-containing protein [Paracoccaceae bacterium]